MSQPTPFAGLTALTPGEPLSDNGFAFQWGDRFLIDRLLRLGAVTHVHDGHLGLGNPIDAAALANDSSGGTIPAGQTVYVTYTWLDANGGETLAATVASVTMLPSISDPLGAPDAVIDYTAGGLLAGTWSYALTLTDGLGGESALGPVVEVTVLPGSPTAQIDLGGMLAIMAAANPSGASGVGWRMWRQAESGPWYLIATGNGDTVTDSGVAGDCTVAPPVASTLGGTNALGVNVPAPAGGTSPMPVQFAIYASKDGSFTSPALLGIYPIADAGVWKTFADLTVSQGAPPRANTSFPGASKIDALTEVDNLGIIAATPQAGDYTLALSDVGRVVESTDAAAATFTIPPHADVAMPVGAVIEVFQYGAGAVTIAGGVGVTLRSDGARVRTAAQYATIGLRQRAVDEWVLTGDLA